MSKKIMLLALAAIGAAALVLPASAMAVEEDIPLHVVPKPATPRPISGGAAHLTTVGGGLSVNSVTTAGTATFETSTTGTIKLEFKEASTLGGFVPCKTAGEAANTITTKVLPFHLVTLTEKKPGILITPEAPNPETGKGTFAEFECAGEPIKVTGNGVIGTITAPACGGSSASSTIVFEAASAGVQRHKTVEGTKTVYHLESSQNGGAPKEAAQAGSGTTMFETSTKLECT